MSALATWVPTRIASISSGLPGSTPSSAGSHTKITSTSLT